MASGKLKVESKTTCTNNYLTWSHQVTPWETDKPCKQLEPDRKTDVVTVKPRHNEQPASHATSWVLWQVPELLSVVSTIAVKTVITSLPLLIWPFLLSSLICLLSYCLWQYIRNLLQQHIWMRKPAACYNCWVRTLSGNMATYPATMKLQLTANSNIPVQTTW